jgi:hypothetical protein
VESSLWLDQSGVCPLPTRRHSLPTLTTYDKEHATVYIRLLDAEADGADWMEVSRTVLRIDPVRELARAHRAWETHLSRAKWLTENGYRQLLRPVH